MNAILKRSDMARTMNIRLLVYIFAMVIIISLGSMYIGSIHLDKRDTIHKTVNSKKITKIHMKKNAKNHIKFGKRGDLISERKNENGMRIVSIKDVYISVKTTVGFHYTRVALILKTWWNQAMEQIYFFTDEDDEKMNNVTGGRLINTHCGRTHKRVDLCCKMQSEYDLFIEKNKKWWCHFDDDNYVNVERLLELLNRYDWTQDLYLGRLIVRGLCQVSYRNETLEFRFANGGAGFCISNSLGRKMIPWCRQGQFKFMSTNLTNSDDVTIGIIVTNLLGISLTQIEELNSHRNTLYTIPESELVKQISLSYRINSHLETNVVNLTKGTFTTEEDPTRILSLHCHIHPKLDWCLKKDISDLPTMTNMT